MNDLSQLSGKELQEKLTWEAPNIAEKRRSSLRRQPHSARDTSVFWTGRRRSGSSCARP